MKRFNSNIGKKLGAIALAVAAAGFGSSQVRADDYATPVEAVAYQPRSMDDLQQLTASIALYPDALLAQVLVASTYPNDVVAASQSLANGADPSQFGNTGWDASVQGLAQTPDVLNQLAANADWMNQLGDAFLNQQQDVFSAVQSLRSQALSAGTLVSNAQEQVIISNGLIQIVPANPRVIYVPRYDPSVVYVAPTELLVEPCITFDIGHPVGLWLHADFDWSEHRVYFGSWGADRPWWRHDRDGDGDRDRDGDYVHNRPGTYITNVRNVTNIRNDTNIRNETKISDVWVHNDTRRGPEHLTGPVRTRTIETMHQSEKTSVREPMQPNRGSVTDLNRNARPALTNNLTPPTRMTSVTTSHTPTVQPNRSPLANHLTPPTRTTSVPTSHTTPVTPNRSPVPSHLTPPTRTPSVVTSHTTPVQPNRPTAPSRPTAPTRTPTVATSHTTTVQPNRPTAPSRPTAPTRTTTVATSHTTTVQPNRPTTPNRPTAPTRTTTAATSHTTVQPSRPAGNSGHPTMPSRPASAGGNVSKTR